ncbi:transposase [Geoglobus sp.]
MEIFKGRASTPPSVPQLTIEIPAMTLTIEYDKKISITTIVSTVLEIARILLKHILEQINEMFVEEYCGKRYERGKMQRNGYRTRTIVTMLGEITLNLAVIRGRGIPLYDIVEFESRRKYQSDIKAISVDSALRMTFRDAKDEVNRFTSSPSHQTIWRYTQELGEKIGRDFKANIYFAEDSTKLHSWHGKIELTIFEGENVVVRTGRERMRMEEELEGLIALGDADKRLGIFEERQIDLIHVWREVNYKLWQHDVDLETRKQYVSKVNEILLKLKNSLDKPDLKSRIKKTEKALEGFIDEMDKNGFWRVARFFRKHMRNILLFAYKRLEGISVPWHNNRMERKMGEISKRMKNKWMKWSEMGAENLGNLLMKMRFERDVYESFIVEVMKLDRDIRWEVNLHP